MSLDIPYPNAILAYLDGFADYYPGIQLWAKKVLREARAGNRGIATVFVDEHLAGLAIIKYGRHSKLCHFSLSESLHGRGLGSLLMLKVVQESISRNAISMHVTTSAQVTKKYGGFFERQGFNPLEFHKDRYVLGDTECVWFATTDDLLQNVSKSQRSYQNTELLDMGKTNTHSIELTNGSGILLKVAKT